MSPKKIGIKLPLPLFTFSLTAVETNITLKRKLSSYSGLVISISPCIVIQVTSTFFNSFARFANSLTK